MKTQMTLAAGLFSALGATACCFGPLLVVSLGFGGAWATRVKGLEAFQPIFVALTLALMAFAFRRLYVQPRKCKPGDSCEAPRILARQRIAFWMIAAAILLMAAFPLFAEYFY